MIRWSICIITVPERKKDLTRLFAVLERQIGDLDIELCVNYQDGSLGEKRQWCIDNTNGEYVSFVDDDDLVAPDFVQTIYPLLDGVDYVGFQVQLYVDGAKQKPTYHSLRYNSWVEDESGFYRNVSHLNPIRREVALQARFDGGPGEDYRWALQVKPQAEHYIDRPMYFYFFANNYSLSKRDA